MTTENPLPAYDRSLRDKVAARVAEQLNTDSEQEILKTVLHALGLRIGTAATQEQGMQDLVLNHVREYVKNSDLVEHNRTYAKQLVDDDLAKYASSNLEFALKEQIEKRVEAINAEEDALALKTFVLGSSKSPVR